MTHYARIAAVTGANKGIGYAIVRNLALTYPKSPLNTGPLLIYLTARSATRGEAALSSIRADADLRAAKALSQDGGLADVAYLPLDITSDESVRAFEAALAERHADGIDVLVNNAGIVVDGFDAGSVRETLRANYYGTLGLCEALMPRVKDGGRVVNVSSMLGRLGGKYADGIARRFREAQRTEEVSALMEEFQAAVARGAHAEEGWPSSAYAVSKSGVTGISRILGKQTAKEGRGVLVNACCPGYVKTDLTKHRARKTPDQGAATPVKLALGDLGGITGEFWEFEDLSSW